MATNTPLTHQSLQQNEDPWFWTTEDVIAALCRDDGPLRSSGSQRSFPEPQSLAEALEENAISGPSLLTDLDHISLRDDLGIKRLGHRTSILHCIQGLRHRSSRYLDHVQTNQTPVFSPVHVGSGSSYTIIPRSLHFRAPSHQRVDGERSSVYSSNYIFPGFDPETYVSPTPSIHTKGLSSAHNYPARPAAELERDVESLKETVNVAEERMPEDSRTSKRPLSPEADGVSFQAEVTSSSAVQIDTPMDEAVQYARSAETSFIDKNGRKRRRLDLLAHAAARAMSPEADGVRFQAKMTSSSAVQIDVPIDEAVQNARSAETSFIDKSGRKRRRLELSAHAPTRAMSPALVTERRTSSSNLHDSSRDINILGDAGSQHEDSPESQRSPVARSLASQRLRAMSLDEQSQKPSATAHVAHVDDGIEGVLPRPRSPTAFPVMHQPSAPLPVNLLSSVKEQLHQTPSVRNPHQVYLGLKPLAVDSIFYGETVFGREIKNDVKQGEIWHTNDALDSDTESFVFSGQPFGGGLRRYVSARIRHYLSSSRLRVQHQENQAVIIPYPDVFIQKHHQLSATVFTKSPTGFITLRMDRSACLQKNFRTSQRNTENQLESSDAFLPQAETTSMDWEFLQKWGRQGVEDRILPVYGESGSEGEYDPQTWQEIEDEKNGGDAPRKQLKKTILGQDEIEEILGSAERQMMDQWEDHKKPGLRRKAWFLWKKSRKNRSKNDLVSSYKRSLEHLEERLFKIRLEMIGTEWSSVKHLKKQCRSMEASIFDRETYLWYIWVLNKKTPPPKMSPRPPKNSGASLREKTSLTRSSDSSDLDGFVVEDDILSENESALTNCRTTEDSGDDDEPSNGESRIESGPRDVRISSGDEGNIPPDRSLVPWQLPQTTPPSRNLFLNPPDLIDLTHESESPSGEIWQANHSPSNIISELSTYHEDPFGQPPRRPATFKKPPGASPLIVIDSDPIEDSIEASIEHSFDLTNPDEVQEILKRDPDEFVALKDRERLLLWTIAKTSAHLRNSIANQVVLGSLKDIESVVWNGLRVFEQNQVMKLPGLDEEDSRSRLYLASWYVCWTIPVRISERGVTERDVRKTTAERAGFPEFFKFLQRVLPFFKSSASESSRIKREKRRRTLNLQEDQPDDLLLSPFKKRKYAVPESDQTKFLRANAKLRVQERDKRQELLKRRFKEMGANDEDASKVIVNPGKHHDQSFIYLNPKIAERMQPHQIDGVRFMWREVVAAHQGCLLAQTMGLGKTMQIITLLVTIAEAAKSNEDDIRAQVPADLRKSRTLILCPPALIENWWDEFLMWMPVPSTANIGELRKVTTTLKISERLWEIQGWQEEGGVLLLGFNIFRDLIQNKAKITGQKVLNDDQHEMVTEALLRLPNIVVADEAHLAKTAGSGINITLNRVRSMSRIALTGSPLANNLEEYHSLIDWIAPGYLGTLVEFKANYVEKIQAGLWQESTTTQYRDSLKRLEALKHELAPKVHRADITVLQGRLKGKQEFVIKVPLTPLQENIYQVYVETMSTMIDKRHSASTVWAWLAILRLLCNHPKCFKDRLLEKDSLNGTDLTKSRKRRVMNASLSTDTEVATHDDADALVDAPVSNLGFSQNVLDKQLAPFDTTTVPYESISLSNKMQVLMDILHFSKEANDKVLIFSHSIHTLDYVEMQLKHAHFTYSRIDGEVPTGSRQQITKNFNYDQTEVCLISTRAGGQGLNLFGANRVVILDGHFNPTHEEQAVGRAYRIGQLKPVVVYHLMIAGTFEEVLQNQSVFKQQLAKRVVDKKNPAPRALRGIGEYLLPPRAVAQQDLKLFEGKDPFVLDRLLVAQIE